LKKKEENWKELQKDKNKAKKKKERETIRIGGKE
jgi:hypothetical protein